MSGPTTKTLCEKLAEGYRREPQEMKNLARVLREAGYLPKGKGGRSGAGSAVVELEHLACMVLGLLGRLSSFGSAAHAHRMREKLETALRRRGA